MTYPDSERDTNTPIAKLRLVSTRKRALVVCLLPSQTPRAHDSALSRTQGLTRDKDPSQCTTGSPWDLPWPAWARLPSPSACCCLFVSRAIGPCSLGSNQRCCCLSLWGQGPLARQWCGRRASRLSTCSWPFCFVGTSCGRGRWAGRTFPPFWTRFKAFFFLSLSLSLSLLCLVRPGSVRFGSVRCTSVLPLAVRGGWRSFEFARLAQAFAAHLPRLFRSASVCVLFFFLSLVCLLV